jgi:WD40 repeat protein
MLLNKLKSWLALSLLAVVTAVGFAAYPGSGPSGADKPAAPPKTQADKPKPKEEWQRREGKVKKDKAVTVVALSADGKTVAVGLEKGAIRFYDVATAKKWAARTENLEDVESLAFSADGKKLAVGSGGKKILVFKVGTGKREWVCDLKGNSGLAFSADGKLLLAGYNWRTQSGLLGYLTVLDAATGKQGVGVSAGGTVNAVAFSHTGHRAVAVCAEPLPILAGRGMTQVSLFDFEEQRPYDGWLTGHEGDVRCAVFSRDDKFLATGGEDKRVIVWDLESGRNKFFTGHTATVRAVAFSKNGKWLASTGDDKTVRVWDVARKRQLARLKGPKEGLRAIHLSADGKKVTAVSALGEVVVWELAPKGSRR